MTTAITEQAQESGVPWWVVLIEGIAAIVIGVLLLTNTGLTVTFLVQVLGIYWLIAGVIKIVSIFLDSSRWGWKLFAGIVGCLAGILILQHPLWSALIVPTTLALVIGIQGIIFGAISVIQAFQGDGWGTGILGGVSILFGLLILMNPLLTGLALPFVAGILGIVGGVVAIVTAFRMK